MAKPSFDPVDPKQSLPKLEEGILQYWKEEDTFKRSMHRRKQNDGNADALNTPGISQKSKSPQSSAQGGAFDLRPSTFTFYDGPPFATGLPHYGHLLAGTIKDVIPRYQTMKGKYVERRFGWDCHGLPIENLVEKEHSIQNKQEIEAMGIAAFNELCRGSVQRYAKEWQMIVERMGRWVDMDWDYRTMDPDYMESIWWVFEQLHKKGLVYEGHKPMHICPRCVTPLSNFEVTQGYIDITDQSVIAKFALSDTPNTFILAWTTTPWTLPGNLFLAVGKHIPYVKVSSENAYYILAKDLVETVFKGKEHEVVETMHAKDLLGRTYKPLFPYFENKYSQCFTIVEGDFVTTTEGTGVVHIAPGFGEDDFQIGKAQQVELLQHVTMEGKFISAVTDFAGMDVKPADDPSKTDRKLIEYLHKQNAVFSTQKYKHSYPHCWRCDSPLLNYATSSWFVKVEQIKQKLLDANSKTEWVPAHLRDGRFGNWLEGARDWAISRNRYWGTPLPLWREEDSGDITILGSRDALMQQKKIRFTKLTALRHGESEGNLIPIYQGELPGTNLTDRGREQAEHATTMFENEKVDIIYCSPMARTLQTAEAIAKATGAEIVIDERLREVEFGKHEGKSVDFNDLTFLKARRAHKLAKNQPESIYHFEGMETWENVYKRMSNFMEEILPKHRSEHVVVVTHADPLQNIRHFFTQEDPVKLSHQPYPYYATPYTFFWDHDKRAQMDLHKHSIDDIVFPSSQSKKSVEVTFVRHGESTWNKDGRIQGQETSPQLTDVGKEQAAKAAAKLKGKEFDVCLCSDLDRTVQTAEIITKSLGLTDAKQLEILRERNFGQWQGKLHSEVENKLTNIPMKSFAFHPVIPPKGESVSAFLQRTQNFLNTLLREYAGKKVLIVGHGGYVQAMRTLLENLSYREGVDAAVENATIYECIVHPHFKRIPEVFDCWFESGSMPYAQQHFPFELKHKGLTKPEGFPADFIAEGTDQTRGWFYTLTVLGAALFDESPFQHCVVNGIVLAEDGKKMSKRLKNYPDPMELANKYGADAIRFTLMSSPAVRAEDLRISEKLVEESLRAVLLPLWNTYSFFVTYANACSFEPIDNRKHSTHPLDLWIRAEVQDLVNRMTKELDAYDLSATCNELHETIDALTNWYVRLSRRRFAGKENPEERQDALHTLYDVLLTISQLLAPFCPYITEGIYLNLVPDEHGSIHFTDWPATRELNAEEHALLEKTRLQRLIVSLGNKIRSEKTVKIRQPLQKAVVAIPPSQLSQVRFGEEDLQVLMQELNVKDIEFSNDPETLAEAIMQVDARKVGPRLGARVQEIIQAGKAGNYTVQDDGSILILDEVLSPEEAQVMYRGKEGQDIAADRGIVVSLDTEISQTLETEGIARDIIRSIQRLRKERGFQFTDTVLLTIEGADDVLAEYEEMITQETKSQLGANKGEKTEVDLDGRKVVIAFEKK